MPPMVSAWDQRDLVRQIMLWQVVGIALMVCHTVLVLLSPLLYPVVILVIGWLFIVAPLPGLLVFVQILLFQNLIVSLFCTPMTPTVFNALLGTNFAILVMLACISTVRLLPLLSRQFRPIRTTILIALALLLIYTAWGTVKAGPTSSLTYFREFSAPIFLGIIGLEVGRIWSFRTVGLCMLYGSILSLLISLAEYFYPLDYYAMTNSVHFLQIKFYSQPNLSNWYTPEDIMRASVSVFFNITGATDSDYIINSYRVSGSVMNPISNVYVISVLGITAVALKQSPWLLLLLPFMLVVGVKGATILLLSSLIMYGVWKLVHHRGLLVAFGICFAVLYVASGIVIGLKNNDFHVLGFMGGVRAVIHNPIGVGVGVGGNLSAKAAAGFKWTGAGGFVSAGADFALESAVGVLIYQMGVAGASVLAVFVAFLAQAPLGLTRQYALPKRTDIIFFALAMVMLNGVFQEEAYAPYAAGLIMLLAGVLIGNGRRYTQVVTQRLRQTKSEPVMVRTRRPAVAIAR